MILLYNPLILNNLIEIVKTCGCFNFSLYIVSKEFFENNELIKIAKNFKVNIFFYTSFDYFLDKSLIAISSNGSLSIKNYKPKPDQFLLFGNEKTGVPINVLQKCKQILYIPTVPNCKCLDLLTSVCITTFSYYTPNYKL